MTDIQDGTFDSRGPLTTKVATVSRAATAALRKQLDQAIQRCAMKDERERDAERAALTARLNGPRPARVKQKGPEPFQPAEILKRRTQSRFAKPRVG